MEATNQLSETKLINRYYGSKKLLMRLLCVPQHVLQNSLNMSWCHGTTLVNTEHSWLRTVNMPCSALVNNKHSCNSWLQNRAVNLSCTTLSDTVHSWLQKSEPCCEYVIYSRCQHRIFMASEPCCEYIVQHIAHSWHQNLVNNDLYNPC